MAIIATSSSFSAAVLFLICVEKLYINVHMYIVSIITSVILMYSYKWCDKWKKEFGTLQSSLA